MRLRRENLNIILFLPFPFAVALDRYACTYLRRNLPIGVDKAFEDGYEITNRGFWATLPLLPIPKNVLVYLRLMILLESTYTIVFWTYARAVSSTFELDNECLSNS